MKCWIYKGSRRQETYLYVPAEGDVSRVPEALLDTLGALELVMSLTLTAGRRLARADPRMVMTQLRERGFYLQMPPPDAPEDERVQ
jgi:uncharacterized protein YcgL (UPF0745 family)